MSVQPPGKGLGLVLALGLTLASGAITFGLWYRSLAPIQTAYLPTYYKAEYLPSPSLLGMAAKPKRYAVLTVDGKDANLSTMPETMRGVGVRYTSTTPDLFSKWLRAAIYEGHTGLELLETPLIVWGVLAFLSMIAGLIVAKKQKRQALEGVKLRGPDMMTVNQFNRVTKGDGFALKTKV